MLNNSGHLFYVHLQTLESTMDNLIGFQINSLFEIVKIVMEAKSKIFCFARKCVFSVQLTFGSFVDNSLNNLVITITNFAVKRLTRPDCCIQALEMLTTIFDHGIYWLRFEVFVTTK